MTRAPVHHHKPRSGPRQARLVSQSDEFALVENLCATPRCYVVTRRWVPVYRQRVEAYKLRICCECLAAHFGGA